jgi:hypothetical protein
VQFELLQKSNGGDLVLGECKMRVSDVVAAGAVHSWFPFINAAEPDIKVGELLMAIVVKGHLRKQTSHLTNKSESTQEHSKSAQVTMAPSKVRCVSRFAC